MTAADPASCQETTRIRVALPHQLRNLARVTGDIDIEVEPPVTVDAVLSALEDGYPTLVGTIRDRESKQRRAMIRIYAAGDDFSDAPPETPIPEAVRDGSEPMRLVGAIAGG